MFVITISSPRKRYMCIYKYKVRRLIKIKKQKISC